MVLIAATTLLLLVQMGPIRALDCSNLTQDWECADHLRMRELNGMYLGDGLRCMGYDKFQSPYAVASSEVERELTSWVSVDLKFTRINELSDEVQVFEPEFWLLLVWKDLRLRVPDICYDANATYIVEENQVPPDLVERHLWMPPIDLTGLIDMQPRRGFARVWMFHMMQTFLPSFLIMVASVLSVFVPASLVPGRMGLCITAFLSMISLINGTRDNWPPTNSLKAIDYWTGICYLLVFAALTEYCIVLYLSRKAYLGIDVNSQAGESLSTWKGKKISTYKNKTPYPNFKHNKELLLASKIESFARLLMPASLILANIIFWTTMTVANF